MTSTRLSLPLGVAGTEPELDPIGSLAYATDTEQVRVKHAAGWADVGGGGGGSITQVDGVNGITSTNPTGPVVTLEPDYGTTANTVMEGNQAASGDLAGNLPAPTVAAIHETSGPTKLTIGSITNGQLLVRSGTTLVGQSGAAPTGAASGDLAGSYPAPEVAAIHETSGPTKLTIGAVATGQALIRTGSTLVGATLANIVDRPGFPFLQKPSSPDAWNWEARDATSPDLATNGFTVTLSLTPWTAQTRSGNIDLASDPAANTYRSQLIAGVLVLQFRPGTVTTIHRAVTSAAFTYGFRAWTGLISGSFGTGVSAFISDNTHRDATGARSYWNGIEGVSTQEGLIVGPATFTTYTNTAVVNGQWDIIKYIHNPAAGNVMSMTQLSGRADSEVVTSGLTSNMRQADRTVTITPTISGVWVNPGSTRGLVFFDFFRRFPLYTYLG